MNYLTGYLPYVSDRDFQRKQTRRRFVIATGLTVLAVLLLFLWGTITSAQDKNSNSLVAVSSNSSQPQVTSDKPIWVSLATPNKIEKTQILEKNSVVQNSDNNVANKEKITISSQLDQLPASNKTKEANLTSDEIGSAYNRDLEILLDKAFSN